MINHPLHHDQPFAFFSCAEAFSAEVCEAFGGLFDDKDDWDLRDEAFYKCFLRECTAELAPSFLRALAGRMREVTHLPLTDDVQVTAQRVMPGQSIGVHSDRPLLGYECARLVVNLNEQWQAEHGGRLELFAHADADPDLRVDPVFNSAFGFVLHPDSHHAVEEVTRVRRSVVFNFWHAGNTPQLEHAIREFLSGLHFSELPSSLDPVASVVEASLSEETTYLAGVTAIVLHRWGFPAPVVTAGYLFSAGQADAAERGIRVQGAGVLNPGWQGGGAEPFDPERFAAKSLGAEGLGGRGLDAPVWETLDDEARCAVQLAFWVAGLYRGAFDVEGWPELRDSLHGFGPFPLLQPLWNLCLP